MNGEDCKRKKHEIEYCGNFERDLNQLRKHQIYFAWAIILKR